MRLRNKLIIIAGAVVLVCIAAIVLFSIGRKEHNVAIEYYDTFFPIIDGKSYIIDENHAGIIDYRSLWGMCNMKCYEQGLKELDFDDEAYLISQGRPIKRAYYKPFDRIELLNKVKGHILYVEFEDVPLLQEEYVYTFDNKDGPYCTEDEKYTFID